MKVKKLGFGLTTLAVLSVIPVSVVTMPLVLNQPVYAQAIYGLIFDKWASMGGSRSPVGDPKTDELPAARGGRYNEFQNGFIYWHPNLGAHAVYGLIGVKWNQLGRENGLGYPITDELPAANGGRFNDFENNASIYWHPSTGAYAVYGDIRTQWVSMGRERSRLGYPISDEQSSGSAGQRVSYFQGGAIYWNSGSRKVTVTYK
ncbi:MAG: hypothetical protein HEQ35_16155 [Gloeotrichia echinulata IR180]|jgi:uncharacterized protein with LGFP repeats|nr:hypothetical protein [Gloeotrichia echinulata DEX184]